MTREVKLQHVRTIWQRLRARLQHRYRFILVDETSHRQSFVFAFTTGGVLAVVGAGIGLVLLANTALIVFTPLREFIPGYTDPEFKARQGEILNVIDSLEAKIASQDSLMISLRRVSGYTPADTGAQRRLQQQTSAAFAAAPRPVAVVNAVKQSPAESDLGPLPMLLIWPVQGNLTSRYSAAERHYAIDLAAAEQSMVRAVAAGTVILAEYSEQTGYVIGVQHAGGLVSFYKHNAMLLKRPGSWVNAGEAIAAVGNRGTHSTGPHLHLELWRAGQPIDPLLLLPPRQERLDTAD